VDVAIAGEILEHITESHRFLGEVRRVLRNGGYLVLSVPNIVSLKYRIAFLLGRIPAMAAKADYTYSPDNPAYPRGHVRDYSFGELRRVLSDCGFVIVAERGIGMHWHGRRVLPPWLMPVTLSDNAIVKALLRK
jgi:SAM-dependent methyltransferase